MNPPCVLLAATPGDAPALAGLEQMCHSHPWTASHFQHSMGEGPSGRRTFILRTPAPATDALRGIVAYCVVETVLDEAHIHNLAVRPDLRRRHVARWLLTQVLALVTRLGASSVFLEVRRSNRAALALYGGMGFREVGTRGGYYRHPTEDALILSREGPPAASS